VFAAMIGVTLFGLIFTPAFYVLCRRLAGLGAMGWTGQRADAQVRDATPAE
jgi:hypothetical protein